MPADTEKPTRVSAEDSLADDWGASEDERGVPAGVNNLVSGPPPAYHGDRHFYRVVVWALATTVAAALAGSVMLVLLDKTPPESMIALGATAVGALAGVVAGQRA